MSEALTIVRTHYDADGNAGLPARDTIELVLTPEAGDELRYEIQQQLTLPPGHYQVRLNATSKVVEKSGSVYAEVEVPGFHAIAALDDRNHARHAAD